MTEIIIEIEKASIYQRDNLILAEQASDNEKLPAAE